MRHFCIFVTSGVSEIAGYLIFLVWIKSTILYGPILVFSGGAGMGLI